VNAEALHEYYAARALEYDRIYQKPERQQDLLYDDNYSGRLATTTLAGCR
jgi:hypothetical protein